ncbi:TadE-like protein [Roseovarius sp. THAF27]|uniref:TadE/TadG family type IV pilus assembly protein n=1 Tax=unclassified Roseovarius TaxID=2614913 RepID=UPI0012695461|nr:MULTISPECIES: TadE family protein [unclassified Roseovarius]QFT81854.1 TadE-like protein [Roseovarius sp. THAF27]QFT99008.1 TadE-like protein [Roseovarius sp. THAF8]
MITKFKTAFRRLINDEAGSATVEFVLVFPLYLSFMLMSIELGFVTMRHTLLERGLDMAVREVRLGTGTAPQHDDIKDLVCDNAFMVLNCKEKLRLEMRPANIFALQTLDTTADCTDKAEPAKPVRTFTPGVANQLMLMRACYKYEPFFPKQFLGSALDKDASGEAKIVSMTAFVQEPN